MQQQEQELFHKKRKQSIKQIKRKKIHSYVSSHIHTLKTGHACKMGSKINTEQKFFSFACVRQNASLFIHSLCCCIKVRGDLPFG